MVSGFFLGGMAPGITQGADAISNDMKLQSLMQLQVAQNEHNQKHADAMQLWKVGVENLQKTVSALKDHNPGWTDQQIMTHPATVAAKNLLNIGGFAKNLGFPDGTVDNLVASTLAQPGDVQKAGEIARATGEYGKTQAQTNEANARTGYLNRGGAALPSADPGNPDGPLPGEGLGDHGSVEDSLKQKYGARTIFKAEQYLAGNTSVLTGLGYGKTGAAARKQVQDAAADLAIARGIKPEEVNAEIAGFMGQKRAASAAGLRVGNVTVAMDAAQAASKRVLETSAKVDRTAYPSLNSVILAAKKGTGDTNVVQYGIAVNTLVNNYARAVGGGNAQLTDAARKEAYDNLNAAWSKGQIGAAVEQINKEIASELSGAQKAMKDVTTKPKGDGEWKVERID